MQPLRKNSIEVLNGVTHRPGQPGSETWPKDADAILHGGGMTWMTGTYDSELSLLYWGTGWQSQPRARRR